MKNTYIIFRHAQTEKDPKEQATRWVLSEEGSRQAEALAHLSELRDIDIIITSTEEKASLTAKPIADLLGIDIIRDPQFDEQKRGKRYLSDHEFKRWKERKLTELDYRTDGDETSRESLVRFIAGIDSLEKRYNNKRIMIVSHATILALYFSDMLLVLEDAFTRWKRIGFCSYGIIKDGAVQKDICK